MFLFSSSSRLLQNGVVDSVCSFYQCVLLFVLVDRCYCKKNEKVESVQLNGLTHVQPCLHCKWKG